MALNKDINVGSSTIAQYTNTINNRNYTTYINKGNNIKYESLIKNIHFDSEIISRSPESKIAGATVLTSVLSITEGMFNWGEKVADALKTMSYYEVGKIFRNLGLIDEKGFQDVMKEAQVEIAEDDIKYLYNAFWDDTKIGNNTKDNLKSFQTIRNVSAGVGEASMNVGMAIVGELDAVIASAVITGFGEGASESFKNNTSTDIGIKTGAVNAAWNSLQYGVGYIVLSPFGKDLLNQTIPNSLRNTVISGTVNATVDGLDGVAQPFIKTIHDDSDGSFKQNYAKNFNEAGGVKNVVANASIGAVTAGISDRMGIDSPTIEEGIQNIIMNGDDNE